MRMSTAAALALTVLLATSGLGAVAAATPSAPASTTGERSPPTSPFPALALEQPESVSALQSSSSPLESPETRQVIRVRITDDGDAEWYIESRFLVTDDSEAETFHDYADAVMAGQRDPQYDPRVFDRYASRVAESNSREMDIENAGWDGARIEPLDTDDEPATNGDDVRVGILSYSFTWTNFGTVDGDRIRVGDSFQTTEGLLFESLASWQRLVIEPPENYGFVDAPTGTENGSLVWNGPYHFEEDGLEMTLLQGAGPNSPNSNTTVLIAALLGVVALIGAGGYVLARRKTDDDREGATDPLASLATTGPLGLLKRLDPRERDGNGSDGTTTHGDGGAEPVANAAVDSPAAADTDGGSGTHLEFEEPVDDEIDPELLSDEERVLRLLKRNGGRMKQASIVTETGWSNAKVSQLLSKMDDDDEIEKLRIGRENLITLPGVDPTEVE
ncbi:helix-turn-helix transcriptional regulator [Natrinema ejinorense]|uniref:HTH iclR-type domain-containing protein n=1 Tax=Natrinema ejinorense TaxID=373386 RepID=A0A2A5R116_9EURY|nr:hypothetical protein [Natrinema ejinorense]PCR92808.1 hypothetical protein CP557_19340 [Natrinema ejinorense]